MDDIVDNADTDPGKGGDHDREAGDGNDTELAQKPHEAGAPWVQTDTMWVQTDTMSGYGRRPLMDKQKPVDEFI